MFQFPRLLGDVTITDSRSREQMTNHVPFPRGQGNCVHSHRASRTSFGKNNVPMGYGRDAVEKSSGIKRIAPRQLLYAISHCIVLSPVHRAEGGHRVGKRMNHAMTKGNDQKLQLTNHNQTEKRSHLKTCFGFGFGSGSSMLRIRPKNKVLLNDVWLHPKELQL